MTEYSFSLRRLAGGLAVLILMSIVWIGMQILRLTGGAF